MWPWLSSLCFCLSLVLQTSGTSITLNSNLVEYAGNGIVCIGKPVIFECNGEDIAVMRWTMEPFINDVDPVTFTLIDDEKCLSRVNSIFSICLTSISLTPDGALANMTSTLNFSAMETINGLQLNGSVVMCDEENTTLVVIKESPPLIPELNCTTACNGLNFTILCTWTPLPEDDYIRSYNFNISIAKEMQVDTLTLEQTANETVLEFSLLCNWNVTEILAFSVNECGIAGTTTSAPISGNCTCPAIDSEVEQNLMLLALLCLILVVGAIIALIVGILVCKYKDKGGKYFPGTYYITKVQITWTKCEDFPIKMSHMHVVKIENKLYCGGGFAESKEIANKVFTCECLGSRPGRWRELPGRCPVVKFALTHYTIDGQVKLVTVGGRKYMKKEFADKLYVHSTEDEDTDWESGLSSLSEPKYHLAALNYRVADNTEYIIACGGIPPTDGDNDQFHANYQYSDTIEIFDGKNWKSVGTLPMKRSCLSLVNVGNKFYVVGGGKIGTACNDAAVYDFQTKESERIESCPLAGSTAIYIENKLLVISGKDILEEVKQSVYAFTNGKWEKIQVKGDVPSIYMAAAKRLSDNEFIMIGGQHRMNTPEDSVYIGTFETTY